MKFFVLILFYLIPFVLKSQVCPLWTLKSHEFNSFPSNIRERTSGWEYFDEFSDEFSGTSLDLSKWRIFNNFCHGMSPMAYFKNSSDNIFVENDTLKLRAKHESNSYQCEGKSYNYSSGYIGSINTFQYGYVEIKCFLPTDIALNPCFWFFGDNGENYDEIDVFEKLLDPPSNEVMMQNFYHDLYYPDTSKLLQLLDFNQNFVGVESIYAIEWLPYELNYYLNGNLTSAVRYTTNPDYYSSTQSQYTCADYINAIPQWLQLSLSLNTWVNPNSNLFAGFDILYVKSYKLVKGFDYEFWPISFSMTNQDMFKVHKSVRLGGTHHSAVIPSGENITMWATDGIVLDKGFLLSGNTEFTARVIVTHDSLFYDP